VKFSEKTRHLIRCRAQNRCEICGVSCINGEIHHRRPRGMGGSKDPVCGSPANGILLHTACHRKVESNREQALERGWLVRQSVNPETVPFRRYDIWMMLNSDGTVTPFSSGPEREQ
jgi:hypothetical protein